MKSKLLSLIGLSVLLASCKTNIDDPSNEKKSEQSSITEQESQVNDNTYKATVLLPDGQPVNNAKVQWCTTENCFAPVSTNSDGIATTNLEPNTYYVHVDSIPNGYTYDPNCYQANPENKDVTINLIAISNATGSGLIDDPYNVGTGCYEVNFTSSNDIIYFNLSVTEAGYYRVYSLATDLLATKPINPCFGYYGTEGFDKDPIDEDDDSGIGANFIYPIEITDTSLTYGFALMGLTIKGKNTPYPTGYCFVIEKI